jgi:hypothetical protein
MKRVLVFLIAASATTGAIAQNVQTAPMTLTMTCAQARYLVASRGAVILRTSPGSFDRYVRDSTFCVAQTTTEPAWVRTADVAQCPVGNTCRPVELQNEP